MRGTHNRLGEGERKVRLGQDSLPNIAISVVAESSGNYIRCFTRTRVKSFQNFTWNYDILLIRIKIGNVK